MSLALIQSLFKSFSFIHSIISFNKILDFFVLKIMLGLEIKDNYNIVPDLKELPDLWDKAGKLDEDGDKQFPANSKY